GSVTRLDEVDLGRPRLTEPQQSDEDSRQCPGNTYALSHVPSSLEKHSYGAFATQPHPSTRRWYQRESCQAPNQAPHKDSREARFLDRQRRRQGIREAFVGTRRSTAARKGFVGFLYELQEARG